jgi:hypothetical protein
MELVYWNIWKMRKVCCTYFYKGTKWWILVYLSILLSLQRRGEMERSWKCSLVGLICYNFQGFNYIVGGRPLRLLLWLLVFNAFSGILSGYMRVTCSNHLICCFVMYSKADVTPTLLLILSFLILSLQVMFSILLRHLISVVVIELVISCKVSFSDISFLLLLLNSS